MNVPYSNSVKYKEIGTVLCNMTYAEVKRKSVACVQLFFVYNSVKK